MNEFEKDLQTRLQNERIPEPHSDKLWSRIQDQVHDEQKGRMKMTHTKKWLVAASLLCAVTVAGGVYGGDIVHAASSMLKQVFGSIENVQQVDPHANEQAVENDLQVAKSVLSEDEFKNYAALLQERTRLMQKAIEIVDGQQVIHEDRLSAEDKTMLEKNEQQLRPLQGKIDNHFVSSVAEAAKILPFAVHRPAYVPAGYTLAKEEAKSPSTTGAVQPIVSFTYKSGEFGFTVRESAILTGEADEYSQRSIEQEQSYELHGTQVKYGKIGKNVTAMKMIVPAKGTAPSYQIFVIADVLSKQDVEKVALSMLEK
jgi:bla regulator protein blaR1